MLREFLGEDIVLRTPHVPEAVAELLAVIVFLVGLRRFGPQGRRIGAFFGAVILCAISMAIFDYLVLKHDRVMSLSLPLYPYMAIQFFIWIVGAVAGAECECWVIAREPRLLREDG